MTPLCGGIGTTAIQFGKAMGAKVFVTAGSEVKCEACRRLGADIAINYHREDYVSIIHAATEGKGVDVILDMVGGDYIQRNPKWPQGVVGLLLRSTLIAEHDDRLFHSGSHRMAEFQLVRKNCASGNVRQITTGLIISPTSRDQRSKLICFPSLSSI
ncbi:MAG: zinc-binding dehydrogenase [Desulfobulbus sp.]|nr:zinc-binding dehydrogenase [Desulfobulbus sp.]